MKILITDYVWPNVDIERKIIEDYGHELIVAPNSDTSTLKNLIKDVDAILFCFADINEEILESAEKCKVACRYGIGLDNIDIKKATELGIMVTNIPDYCLDEVSDHVLAMLLNLNRSIMPHDKKVKEGLWHEVNKVERVRRLNKSTLGIIGYGRIGKKVAKKANVFGIEIIAFDPLLKHDDEENSVKSVSLDYLFKNSDFTLFSSSSCFNNGSKAIISIPNTFAFLATFLPILPYPIMPKVDLFNLLTLSTLLTSCHKPSLTFLSCGIIDLFRFNSIAKT
jgi:D-3-phosphoglycerate dehydrogenase